ncbi:hypothetical protein [Paraburkholderia franconis]|nr:hypothetical protein [Paraburkholderia franconis]
MKRQFLTTRTIRAKRVEFFSDGLAFFVQIHGCLKVAEVDKS